MKALLSREPGGPDTLHWADIPAPVPGPGQLLVRTAGVGLNFPDGLIIEDLYQIKPERPFSPGGELAGMVEMVGEGVAGFRVGDAVVAVTLFGALQELVVIDASNCAAIAAEFDLISASVFPFVYGTVWHALVERGGLKEGERVLVLGAGGGIGQAACEVAKALGGIVLAAASSREKLDAALAAGADVVIEYPAEMTTTDQRPLGAALKSSAGPSGIDVVVDPVGGLYAEPALRAVGWEGRYLVIGFTAGIPNLPLNLPLLKGCDIRGVFWGEVLRRNPNAFSSQVGAMLEHIKAGRLRPKPTVVLPFDKASDGIALIKARAAAGKIAIDLRNLKT
ncbi:MULTISPECIES: NADPH:quinone oxidoreductase family protein [unclassified Chelatococcus]|uniref:NADPH:quinone oxidoreductase family protein n=1 Tax=unclassified Chelatococcus TaxID=2638111 RepID=UPI001BD12B56|nr:MULTISPECIES: NADPH:quinone oxidoreductase family protein [unclassified Chelatococcus]MBS7701385.1 NADPH:quinone oxidoreductase family protein [Chelatococcus sp. YT9]MBX3557465.1 NADPH:quinone oxidoreductase family protein [Chelatococcus sp.]